jgi:hypothetical protein
MGQVSVANTGRDGTGTIVTILTAVTAGTRIERVVAKSTGDPQDGILTVFLHDGTNYGLFDEYDMGNPAAASVTQEAWRIERAYRDLVLPNLWSIRAAITVAPSAGVIQVFAFGADLT